jgi:gamma-glutamylcyclotransferase (GGCT)/AIG2-like uncharacterized protein YtfP
MISVLTQRLLKLGAIQAVKWQERRYGEKRPEPQIFYFAYGANLHLARFEKYRMNVKAVGVARLPGYKLTFELPCEYEGKGYGSVSASEGSEVWGYLYRIDRLSLFLLDTMEWAVIGQYRRFEAEAHLADGKRVKAQVYQARHPKAGLQPSLVYRDLIGKAAEHHGFPESYRLSVLSHPAKERFPLDPTFSFIHPHKPRWFAKRLSWLYLWHDRLREKLCDWLRF